LQTNLASEKSSAPFDPRKNLMSREKKKRKKSRLFEASEAFFRCVSAIEVVKNKKMSIKKQPTGFSNRAIASRECHIRRARFHTFHQPDN
jgi:hypothetical protein